MQNETVAATINGKNEATDKNTVIELKNVTIRNISIHGEGARGRAYITINKELDVTSEDGIVRGNTFHVSLYSLFKAMQDTDDLIFAISIIKDFTDNDWKNRKDSLNTTIKKLMLLNYIDVKYQIVPAGGTYVDTNSGEIKSSPYAYDTVFYAIDITKVFSKNIAYADSI